ncbi:MAG: hypothetical protein AAB553_07405, partial [Patescibacteria group bacterium]
MTKLKNKYLKKEAVIIGITVLLLIGLPIMVFVSSRVTNFFGQAAGIAATEPEDGTFTNNVAIVDDPNASGGKYIKFGSTSITSPTTVATVTSSPSPTTTPTPISTSSPTISQLINCIPNPSSCGYPDSTNTGVSDSIVLTPSGSMTVTTAGAVIDGRDITGQLTIRANNVTVKNTKITYDASSFGTLYGNALKVDPQYTGV